MKYDAALACGHALVVAVATIALWVALFCGLCALAMALRALSRRVLRHIASARSDGGRRYAILFRLHAGALLLCCACYYVSVVWLIAALLAVAGGCIFAVVQVGPHPIRIVVLLAAVVVLLRICRTVAALLSGLFAGVGDDPPGRKLELDEEPELRRLLDEIAARVGTRRVDSVYLTAGAELGIAQRGPIVAQLRGNGERCLVLGLALLEGLQMRAFAAVVAHEYGHFRHHSFVCDGLARIVERSLGKSARRLQRARTDRWWNPAWLCLAGIRWLFGNVKRGASRICELRADRVAAAGYGPRWVHAALRQATANSARFEAHLHSVVSAYLRLRRPLVNLYRTFPEVRVDAQAISERTRQRLAFPGRRDGDHPALCDRLMLVSVVEETGAASMRDEAPAWSLFSDREQCERQVTSDFRAALRGDLV